MTDKDNKELLEEEKEINDPSLKQGKFFMNLLIALILLIPIMFFINLCTNISLPGGN